MFPVGVLGTSSLLSVYDINCCVVSPRCCSKSCCRKKKSLLDENESSEGETETEVETKAEWEKSKDETITDPCRCCYRWGLMLSRGMRI